MMKVTFQVIHDYLLHIKRINMSPSVAHVNEDGIYQLSRDGEFICNLGLYDGKMQPGSYWLWPNKAISYERTMNDLWLMIAFIEKVADGKAGDYRTMKDEYQHRGTFAARAPKKITTNDLEELLSRAGVHCYPAGGAGSYTIWYAGEKVALLQLPTEMVLPGDATLKFYRREQHARILLLSQERSFNTVKLCQEFTTYALSDVTLDDIYRITLDVLRLRPNTRKAVTITNAFTQVGYSLSLLASDERHNLLSVTAEDVLIAKIELPLALSQGLDSRRDFVIKETVRVQMLNGEEVAITYEMKNCSVAHICEFITEHRRWKR